MIKQCIIIRKDLKMRRGKEITQGSHASSYFMTSQFPNIKIDKEDIEWVNTGQTKITLVVNSEEELLELFKKAKGLKLKAHIITDAGRTEFNGVPTKTALAIGPNKANEIDKITGNLNLY